MFTEHMGQTLWTAAPGNNAEIDLGLAEARRFRSNDDVAAHGELTTAAQRETAHSGDHGFANSIDLIPIGQSLLYSFIEGPALGHFLDIGARGKDFFAAGDNDDANVVVFVELLHRQREILDQGVGERVE